MRLKYKYKYICEIYLRVLIMRFFALFICVFCHVFAYALQTELDLRTGQLVEPSDSFPLQSVEKYDDSIIVTYEIPFAHVKSDAVFQNAVQWGIKGFGINNVLGEAAFPIKLDIFEVPDNMVASIVVVDTSYVEFPYELAPARPPLTDSRDDYHSIENILEIKPYIGFYPVNVAEKDDVQKYRGHLMQTIRIYPVQYDYSNKIVRAYTFIRYKIVFQESMDMRKMSKKNVTTKINSIYSSNYVNPDYKTDGFIKQDYLIVSTSKYLDAVDKFANWKELMGFNMHIELRDSWQSPSEVKNVISEIYNKNQQLLYLLIIGDIEDVPSSTSDLLVNHVTDLYYSCMDGEGDYISDIFQGRLSVSTVEEAMVVIDKIIQYEQSPPKDNAFFLSGLNCAVFEDRLNSARQMIPDTYADRRFAQTAEEIRQYLTALGKNIKRAYFTDNDITPMYWNNDWYSIGEAIPDELLKPTFAWNATSTDIVNAINQGCLYVLFRGHGGPTFWDKPNFKTANVDQLVNNGLLPIVFSISCNTGNFSYSQPCIAEKFIRHKNGGAVAVYAASETSFSGYNDALISGMIDAVWPIPGLRPVYGTSKPLGSTTPEPTYRLGQILQQGLTRLMETFGAGDKIYNQYHSEIFHCFGDPSMRIYSETPTNEPDISVYRNDSIGEISIDLNGLLADITVCDHWNDKVICYRGDEFSYETTKPQYVSISVSGANMIPFISKGIEPSVVVIQNDLITNDSNFNADVIKIGSDVSDFKPKGSVMIKDGETTISASKIIIKPNTTITSESKVTLIVK